MPETPQQKVPFKEHLIGIGLIIMVFIFGYSARWLFEPSSNEIYRQGLAKITDNAHREIQEKMDDTWENLLTELDANEAHSYLDGDDIEVLLTFTDNMKKWNISPKRYHQSSQVATQATITAGLQSYIKRELSEQLVQDGSRFFEPDDYFGNYRGITDALIEYAELGPWYKQAVTNHYDSYVRVTHEDFNRISAGSLITVSGEIDWTNSLYQRYQNARSALTSGFIHNKDDLPTAEALLKLHIAAVKAQIATVMNKVAKDRYNLPTLLALEANIVNYLRLNGDLTHPTYDLKIIRQEISASLNRLTGKETNLLCQIRVHYSGYRIAIYPANIIPPQNFCELNTVLLQNGIDVPEMQLAQ